MKLCDYFYSTTERDNSLYFHDSRSLVSPDAHKLQAWFSVSRQHDFCCFVTWSHNTVRFFYFLQNLSFIVMRHTTIPSHNTTPHSFPLWNADKNNHWKFRFGSGNFSIFLDLFVVRINVSDFNVRASYVPYNWSKNALMMLKCSRSVVWQLSFMPLSIFHLFFHPKVSP